MFSGQRPRRRTDDQLEELSQMMDGMGGMMGWGMGLIGLLALVLVVLGIGALVKYLSGRKWSGCNASGGFPRGRAKARPYERSSAGLGFVHSRNTHTITPGLLGNTQCQRSVASQ